MTAATTTTTPQTHVDPLLSEEFQTDPASVLARLRVEDPVHEIPGIGGWMVSRYDDVRALFTHPDTTNDRRAFEHYELSEDPMDVFLRRTVPSLHRRSSMPGCGCWSPRRSRHVR
jgi:cytochrome P450